MSSRSVRSAVAKAISILVLVCLLLSALGPGVALAQGAVSSPARSSANKVITAKPSVAGTSPAADLKTVPAPPLELAATVQLNLTAKQLAAINPATAGDGKLFRARVQLHQPNDINRLKAWNIQVLSKNAGYAFVEVDGTGLAKLARLGFKPDKIDSLDYLVKAFNSIKGANALSTAALAASPKILMSLSSVDSDSDGLTDTEESWWCTDPLNANSDHAGPATPTDPNDGTEVADILKGITSYGPPFAMWPKYTPYNPNGNCPDGDFDSVPDNAELYMIGTSPMRESSDLDKFDDGQELFGITYCPGTNGTCGYGILPRAEDAAWVSANMPAWVKAPGNSPFVAAFPDPEVSIVPSSIKMTQVTVITNTKGTTVGTEKTYGTSSTKGTSTSLANTITWNNWQEVSQTQYQSSASSSESLLFSNNGTLANKALKPGFSLSNLLGLNGKMDVTATAQGAACGVSLGCIAGNINANVGSIFGDWNFSLITINNGTGDQVQNQIPPNKVTGSSPAHAANGQDSANYGTYSAGTQDRSPGGSGTLYSSTANNGIAVQNYYEMKYPVLQSSQTLTNGTSHGGAQTTTTTQYEEQTISQSSTDQYSDNWSTATAVDSSHAADLRFTYNIVNNGTDYAREVDNLTFNIYIGNDPNPAYTYCAVGSTSSCQLPSVSNLFPGDSLTYTSNPVALTLDDMSAIDQGAPIRVVMEDLSFGQDQAFYLDAVNGSVTVAMEDGYDDLDDTVDTYLIPVWSPTDTLQDVVKRYFPVIEDSNGNLLAVFTPESKSAIPARCEQDATIAPANNTQVFCKHALTGTSWWNFYLSDGLNYSGAFKDTLAAPNTSMLVRIVSDRDLDGYNDREEILLGTNPDDATSHPSPNLIAGYTKSCNGNDCTLLMTFQNLGNYDAYGLEAVLYSPDGKVNITNNTIGGGGRVSAGSKVVVGPSDTFQYTITDPSYAEPVIVVSYNDPQGNHRFILPTGTYPSGALVSDLNSDISGLNGKMLADPGVDISSTSSTQAGFVINSPHPTSITNGKLFVEYLDGNGNVLHEDVNTQTFDSGPTVISKTIDLGTYPPSSTILLAFFTDSQGDIIDSSARPLSSFGNDPAPEVNATVSGWKIGLSSAIRSAAINLPNPWDFGTVQPGTTLQGILSIANTGLGDLRYSLTGFDNVLTLASGSPAGTLSPSQSHSFSLSIDTSALPIGSYDKTLTLRTNDPSNGTLTVHITGTIGTPGQAAAYQISPYRPWDQMLYVPGPHNQNDVVTFTNTLADDPTRMYPLYLNTEDGQTMKGVGEYGVDFSGQTAPFGVFGTGADGDLTVTSGQTIYTDNTRSALASTAPSGQLNLTLSNASGFAAGQEVLVIQIQGSGAGNYEFGTIASIASNTLVLSKNLANVYTVGGNSKAQLIRVMQFQNVTVQSGGTLTAHAWDGSTGGILVARIYGNARVDGSINVNGNNGNNVSANCTTTGGGGIGGGFRGGDAFRPHGYITQCGWGEDFATGYQGEGVGGLGIRDRNPNSNGGGGGGQWQSGSLSGGAGGGGGNGTAGGDGQNVPGYGGGIVGTPDLVSIIFGGGGGGGEKSYSYNSAGGGSGGGIVALFSKNIVVNGSIQSKGGNGGDSGSYDKAGGGGAGGDILIVAQNANLGTNQIDATGGRGGTAGEGNGGNGGAGRIHIEYQNITSGWSTNPPANMQQMNYYIMTETNPASLYIPDAVSGGSFIRYSLQYGQRSSNTNGGNQSFTVHLPNRQYSSITLSALIEQVTGSGSTFNFCLDIGSDGTCDWTSNNQSFSGPVPLSSPNLAAALNSYITTLHSSADTLVIPIRVNLSTPADIFLFNLVSAVGQDIDLQPSSLVIAPQNGNPATNIPEGTLVNLNAALTNNGSYKAENFTVAFYLGDPNSSAGGTLIGSTFIESLPGGATSPTQTVVWNTTGLHGPETIYVKADASGAVAESNEGNNVASAVGTVKKKPDLAVQSLTLPDARAGETVSASAVIQNLGEADVSNALIALYNGTTQLGTTTVSVAQGGQATASINFSLPSAGHYVLTVKADPADVIAEADETNNTQTGTVRIGWNSLTLDTGGTNDIAYSSSTGYGWKNGTADTTCGTQIQQSYRQAGSAETLAYQFDNLLPGRRYHLDLTFAACSGDRWENVLVDGHAVSETGTTPQPIHVTSSPQTVSLLLDPADYADGTITLSLQRSSGLSGPLVNIIDLQEVNYCYRDSGPGESAWTTDNHCGYDSTPATDGFNGWGYEPEQTMRFGSSGVNYKFTSLDPARYYNARLTFYEGDNTGRVERILFDGTQAQTITLNSSVQYLVIPVPPASYADGQVIMAIQRTGGDAIVNEVTLEENTRTENNRYPAPTTPPAPTPPPTLVPPQVTINAFVATWSGSQVNVLWSTTTEINNHHFNLYRSTDTFTWTQITTTNSQVQCGNFAGASPLNYSYVDTNVASGMTYYYRLQYSGDGCGGGSALVPLVATAQPNQQPTATVNASSSGNGTITPSGPQVTNIGNILSFTLSPFTGYHIASVTGSTCGGSLVGTIFTTIAITSNCTVIANFAINTYTVNFHGNGNTGGLTSPESVNYKVSTPLTANGFTKTGYHFAGWDTSSPGTTVVYTDGQSIAFTSNIDLYAVWTINNYTITGNAGIGYATLTYTGGSTTAGSDGTYTIPVSYGWSGTVTPSKIGYIFVPDHITYPSITGNQTGQNYTASVPTMTDDNSYALTYQNWSGKTDVKASGGGYHYSSTSGQTAAYTTTVNATSITLLTYKGPDQGKVQILVDNVSKGTFDLYNKTALYKQSITITGLLSKKHTITVRVLGQKNPLSTGTQVRLDAFKVGTTTLEDNNIAVTYGSWIGTTSASAYGGKYRSSSTTGASLTFTITGDQFHLVTALGASYGLLDVYKDGVYFGTYDMYNPTQQWQYKLLISGLGSGTHTIMIQVKGVHNASSIGNTIIFDAVMVP